MNATSLEVVERRRRQRRDYDGRSSDAGGGRTARLYSEAGARQVPRRPTGTRDRLLISCNNAGGWADERCWAGGARRRLATPRLVFHMRGLRRRRWAQAFVSCFHFVHFPSLHSQCWQWHGKVYVTRCMASQLDDWLSVCRQTFSNHYSSYVQFLSNLPPTKEEVYVFARVCLFVCLFVCLSVCLLARLVKNACMDLDEMLRVDRFRDIDELINFWARSGL